MKNYKEDLPSKTEILKHWRGWIETIGGFGMNKPTCWACGYHFNGKFDRKDADWDKIYLAWEKSSLQRCHIIARSLGGTNDPSNLFLMCRKCHDKAPNVNSKEKFMDWVYNQSHFDEDMKETLKELQTFHIPDKIGWELMLLSYKEPFKSWSKNKFTYHWSQRGYGKEFTKSTRVALIKMYIEEFPEIIDNLNKEYEELRKERFRNSDQERSNFIYHKVYATEDFEMTAQILFKLIQMACKQDPYEKRILYVDIEGHRNELKGYDPDMFELQSEFTLKVLLPYVTKIHMPLFEVENPNPQKNLPEAHLTIFPYKKNSNNYQ